jgi:hypothetical protein
MRKIKQPKASELIAALLLTGFFVPASAQQPAPAAQRNKLQLSVECWSRGAWRTVDAQTIFRQRDRIRFRFRASISGYLYILNHSSGGSVSWLFPEPGGSSNRVDSGREILIPAANGSYAIGGPAGFDTLYWIVRSSPFEQVPSVDEKQLDVPSTLISRCPEEDRGKELACIDENAGPRPIRDPQKLQAALGIASSLVARDLTFQTTPQVTEIGTDSDGSSSGIIYQLTIAHH